jgi:hypothetical protein
LQTPQRSRVDAGQHGKIRHATNCAVKMLIKNAL